ncbi:acyl-CoA dehydrogenase family protein [Prauserella muralis]|uniref:Acyl-CoA dehydrogenase n=1 Tax=Prauserella muralis TaxID=588067 RepID=A0A2V4B692_9PSEU|nr:acyl-CoA dehydrogenase family protein [Prauserella muralis]PXY24655.1 acyl-CoA dehydrogenase [Prauserella muralis]TWE27656.1 glutaryl-CoA dehydrogenase [Prauserella muralis]
MTPPHPRDLLGIRELLDDEERQIADTVRAFVANEVGDAAGRWFEEATFPERLVRPLGELGLLGMHLTGYGCAGTSAVAYGLACLELEAADSGLRSFVSVQGSLAMFPIWKYGSPEQKQRWLPPMARGEAVGCFGLTEPDHGSDPGGMRTTARRDGPDWVLNGTKAWITNGTIADVAVVWARTDDGVRGFLVPAGTPGFTARTIGHKLSLRMSATAELVLEDVRLPDTAVLPGVTGLRGPLSCLTEARYGILWGALGAARACYESALAYARDRVQFGRPIGGFQLTQRKLVGMALELNKGLLLALHLGRRKDEGSLPPELVSFGKLSNVRAAIDIARTARTILGANGISLEYPVIRHAANLESVLTYEGTEEMHTLVLGQLLTGQAAFR